MESQTQTKKPGSGDTVSITVSITQAARKKLREMKGILAYPTLDKTVNIAVEMVEMRKVFNIAMQAHGLEIPIEPMIGSKEIEEPIHDQPTDDTIVITKSLMTDDPETQDKVAFCNGLIIEFMLDGMADLKQHIYDGKLKMIRTDDGDPNEWEE